MNKRIAKSLLRAYRGEDLAFFSNQLDDSNPLHLCDAYASKTRFGERIVPGMLPAVDIDQLTASLVGPHRILERDVRFVSPIRVHELVRIEVWGSGSVYEAEVFNTVTGKVCSAWKTEFALE